MAAIFAFMVPNFRKILLLSVCTLLSLSGKGQTYTARDSSEVMQWYAKGFDWESINLDSAMACYDRGLNISKRKGFLYGQVKYYFNATAVHQLRGNKKLALHQNQTAAMLALKSGNGELIGKSLFNLGISYTGMGKPDSGYLYQSRGLLKLEAIKDSHGIAACLSSMAKIKADQMKFAEAYELNKKAILLHEKGFGTYVYAQALNNMGLALWKLNRRKEAEMAFKKAYRQARKTGDIQIQCSALSGLGEILKVNHDYQGLKTTGQEIYRIGNAHQLSGAKSTGLYLESLGYYYTRNYPKALELAQKGYAEAVKDSLLDEMDKLMGTIGTIFIGLGELEKSDSADVLRNEISRKIMSLEVDKNIELADARSKAEIRQLQLDVERKANMLQKTENELKTRLIAFLAALILLTFFVVFLIIKNQKKQEKIARQEADIQKQKWQDSENRRQIEVLDSLIKGEENERTRIARDLHDGLGGLLSGVKMSVTALKKDLQLSGGQDQILNNSLVMLENATGEMRNIARNMMPDALLRFGLEKALSDYCYSVSSKSGTSIHFSCRKLDLPAGHPACIPVYRIIQELVNNALKHSQAEQIIVQLSQNENILLVETEDNGIGFDPQEAGNKKGSGFNNLRNRIHYLKGKIEIQSSPGKGSSFYLEIPV